MAPETVKLYRVVQEPFIADFKGIEFGIVYGFNYESIFYDLGYSHIPERTISGANNILLYIGKKTGLYFFLSPDYPIRYLYQIITTTAWTWYPLAYRIIEYEVPIDIAIKWLGYASYSQRGEVVETFLEKDDLVSSGNSEDYKNIQDTLLKKLFQVQEEICKEFQEFCTSPPSYFNEIIFDEDKESIKEMLSKITNDTYIKELNSCFSWGFTQARRSFNIVRSPYITGKSWRINTVSIYYRFINGQIDLLKNAGCPLEKIDNELFKELERAVCGELYSPYDLDRNRRPYPTPCADQEKAKQLIRTMQIQLNK